MHSFIQNNLLILDLRLFVLEKILKVINPSLSEIACSNLSDTLNLANSFNQRIERIKNIICDLNLVIPLELQNNYEKELFLLKSKDENLYSEFQAMFEATSWITSLENIILEKNISTKQELASLFLQKFKEATHL